MGLPVSRLQASSCGSHQVIGQAKDQEDQRDPMMMGLSPQSVALDRWRADRSPLAQSAANGRIIHTRHVETGERVEVRGSIEQPPRILVGSFDPLLDEMDCMQHTAAQEASDHLLGPGQDKTPSDIDPVASTFVETNQAAFDFQGMSEEQMTPPPAQRDNLFMVSLSDGTATATCPAATGSEACTPCTHALRPSVDALCTQLRQATTPLIAKVPSREPIAPKRRPRQKRAPVSNPRRSVRIAGGVGRGSRTSKQQNVLIRKLCLANEGETISDDALQAYTQLFDRPLTDAHIKAILALFGWEPAVLPLFTEGDAVEGHH